MDSILQAHPSGLTEADARRLALQLPPSWFSSEDQLTQLCFSALDATGHSLLIACVCVHGRACACMWLTLFDCFVLENCAGKGFLNQNDVLEALTQVNSQRKSQRERERESVCVCVCGGGDDRVKEHCQADTHTCVCTINPSGCTEDATCGGNRSVCHAGPKCRRPLGPRRFSTRSFHRARLIILIIISPWKQCQHKHTDERQIDRHTHTHTHTSLVVHTHVHTRVHCFV